ncbi:MAG: hypothetical protein AAFU03_14630, partial [Bacteroidota bacterium]
MHEQGSFLVLVDWQNCGLNPLKGMVGYEPIQQGMKTVLPELNHFGSAHNFASLLELEKILVHA